MSISVGAAILGAGALAAGGSMANSFMSRKWQKEDYTKSMHDNFLLQQFLQQQEREYNHPKAVMARLREAGLNPNLIYGQGAGSLTSKTVSPSYGKRDSPNFYSGLDNAASYLQLAQNLENNQAQIDQIRQNTENAYWLGRKEKADALGREHNLALARGTSSVYGDTSNAGYVTRAFGKIGEKVGQSVIWLTNKNTGQKEPVLARELGGTPLYRSTGINADAKNTGRLERPVRDFVKPSFNKSIKWFKKRVYQM